MMFYFATMRYLLWFIGCGLAQVTPPLPSPSLLISEVNADVSANPETKEYIELWNTGNCQLQLDGYGLGLYSGDGDSPSLYDSLGLGDRCMPGNSFFLIGGATLTPKPDVFVNKTSFIQNGNGKADAVALYRYSPAPSEMVEDNLLDVIVYDKESSSDTSAFMPDPLDEEEAVFEDKSRLPGDESMSRCSNHRTNMADFTVGELSPGAPNPCLPDHTTRWPSPCPHTVFASAPSLRSFTYTTLRDAKVTDPPLVTLAVRSATECSVECSRKNLCTHFSFHPQSDETYPCTLHNGCVTNTVFSKGTITGEKYYIMTAKNPHWPHAAVL